MPMIAKPCNQTSCLPENAERIGILGGLGLKLSCAVRPVEHRQDQAAQGHVDAMTARQTPQIWGLRATDSAETPGKSIDRGPRRHGCNQRHRSR
jgi:hypothetical protein